MASNLSRSCSITFVLGCGLLLLLLLLDLQKLLHFLLWLSLRLLFWAARRNFSLAESTLACCHFWLHTRKWWMSLISHWYIHQMRLASFLASGFVSKLMGNGPVYRHWGTHHLDVLEKWSLSTGFECNRELQASSSLRSGRHQICEPAKILYLTLSLSRLIVLTSRSQINGNAGGIR